METYPIDLEARQIVQWLIEEQRRGTLQLHVFATRSYVGEALGEDELRRLGEEEGDLNGGVAIGMLEIRPLAAKGGWTLLVRVEDRIGSRLPDDDDDALDGEEEIHLEMFQAEFIVPECGLTEVLLNAEDAHAKAQFTRVFKKILSNQHKAAAQR